MTPGLVYRVNHWTDATIITACCDEHVCVKLFNPSLHRCGFIYVRALQDLARQGVIEGNLANLADRVVQQVAEQDEEHPPLKFEVLIEDEIEQGLKQIARQEAKKKKRGGRGDHLA